MTSFLSSYTFAFISINGPTKLSVLLENASHDEREIILNVKNLSAEEATDALREIWSTLCSDDCKIYTSSGVDCAEASHFRFTSKDLYHIISTSQL